MVDGRARIFLTHVNEQKRSAAVTLVAMNESDRAITLTQSRAGDAATSKDYAWQGREALVAWIGEQCRDV